MLMADVTGGPVVPRSPLLYIAFVHFLNSEQDHSCADRGGCPYESAEILQDNNIIMYDGVAEFPPFTYTADPV